MHPEEVGHAKNTGQLLHLCLPQSRVEVGERFEPEVLDGLLHAPWSDARKPDQTVLLYPASPEHPATDGAAHSGLTRLVILDATWRKSRQMISANPQLESLPRLALTDVPASRYAIRKAHAEHQLSTLEATHLALRELEPGNASVDALSEAMNALMELQRPFWPHATQLA